MNIRAVCFSIAVTAAGRMLGADSAATPTPSGIENSVVKIFSTSQHPDIYKPWTKQAPSESTGSGVVIEGKRILSNAHVVEYASQVQVQANRSGDRLLAKVVAIAPAVDLAVLELEDDSFFDTHPPISRESALPRIKDAVLTYGYPEGGDSLSITRGIISRIEFTPLTPLEGGASGLRIQIDAAINPGNSGGPAVVADKLIGLCYRRLGSADNIGYILPCEEIELFLRDIADGHYDGKPRFYGELQTLENPALRSFLRLDKSVTGIVVHRPAAELPDNPLKEWDVITRIGDVPVDNQGMINLGSDLRVSFAYEIQKLAQGGKVPLTVIRGGIAFPVQLPVPPKLPRLVPVLENTYPSYFIFGPMVFSTVTVDWIHMDGNWIRWLANIGSPIATRMDDKPAFEGENLVVVSSPFFPHRLAKGYSPPYAHIVKSVNGTKIKNLRHLVEVLRDDKGEYVTIAFHERSAETMIFPRAEVLSTTESILNENQVRSQGSPDMMDVWKVIPGK